MPDKILNPNQKKTVSSLHSTNLPSSIPMVEIPLVVTLWEHINYKGTKRVIHFVHHKMDGILNLNSMGFNDMTSSITIQAGNTYNNYTDLQPMVRFCRTKDLKDLYEDTLLLGVGNYQNLHEHSWGDCISSLNLTFYNKEVRSDFIRDEIPPPIGTTPFIIKLGFRSSDPLSLILLESARNIPVEYGEGFNDSLISVFIEPGPDYSESSRVRFHRDIDFKGGYVEFGLGIFSFAEQNFNNEVSSIEIIS